MNEGAAVAGSGSESHKQIVHIPFGGTRNSHGYHASAGPSGQLDVY